MVVVEVELRSFISEEQYTALSAFFTQHSTFLSEDEQLTHYFDGDYDLRIQKGKQQSKVWLKKGALHDEAREEIEIKTPADDFEKLEKLFSALGYTVQITWLRKRKTFEWNGVSVMLDHTKGYGYILEMEKLCSEEEKEAALSLLKECFKKVNIPLTPREEFEKRYVFYKQNWRTLLAEK